MRYAAILLLLVSIGAPARLSMQHFYPDITQITSARLKECASQGGCHVITQAELLRALKAAHQAGKRGRQ